MSDSHSHGAPAKAGHDSHVPHDAEHFHDHSKLYLGIGGALIALTVLTVAISYVHFGSEEMNMLIGVLLAAFKASLVAAIFMHLKEERGTIYQFMSVTMIFFFALFLLTLLAFKDHIHL